MCPVIKMNDWAGWTKKVAATNTAGSTCTPLKSRWKTQSSVPQWLCRGTELKKCLSSFRRTRTLQSSVYLKLMCFLWQFLLNYLSIHFERDEPVLRIVINFSSSFAVMFEKLIQKKPHCLSYNEQYMWCWMVNRCLYKASHPEWLAKIKQHQGSSYLFCFRTRTSTHPHAYVLVIHGDSNGEFNCLGK